MKDLTQQMVDLLFSFGELGFQEFETSKYLHRDPEEHGFTIEESVAGIPTAGWRAGDPASRSSRSAPTSTACSHVAEAGRALPEADHRGRAGPRRGAQLRRPAEHHGGARGEDDHGAREARPARSSSGRASPRNCSAARRSSPGRRVQGRGRRALLARRDRHGRELGRGRAAPALCRSSTRSPARARTPARRRGAAAARSTPSS